MKTTWKRSQEGVLLGLGIIVAGLLITVMVIGGDLQVRAQPYEQGAIEKGICGLISAQISDLVRAWEGTSVPITVERDSDGYTLRSGRIVLMLRCFQSGISPDEIIVVQEYILHRAITELGEPDGPIAKALPGEGGGAFCERGLPLERYVMREVSFGHARGDDWVGNSYSRSVGAYEGWCVAECVASAHQGALEWFEQQLVSQHGSQGHVSNKHEIP